MKIKEVIGLENHPNGEILYRLQIEKVEYKKPGLVRVTCSLPPEYFEGGSQTKTHNPNITTH